MVGAREGRAIMAVMSKLIAIVEDDPDQRGNYADAIVGKGYDVAAYASRQEALDGFDVQMPDLAVLDIKETRWMPASHCAANCSPAIRRCR